MWAGVAAGVILAAVVCYGVATQRWIAGSAEGDWVYPYVAAYDARHARMFARLAAGALILLTIPVNRRTAWSLVVAWILAATLAHWHLRTRAPVSIERVFLSPGANSFYTLAQERRPGEILANFEQVRLEAPMHAQSNLPGKTLLVHALEMVSTRTDVLPWLLVILSNLGALLMFGLARDLFSDDRAALYAAVLYLFTPSRVFFFPLMNTVTPVFVLLFAWLTLRWFMTGRSSYAAASGVALYALVFFEPLPLVMGLLLGALGIAAIARGDIRFERFMAHAGLMVLVFVAVAVAVDVATGFHLWQAVRAIGKHAVAFNEAVGRPYGVWVRANLIEFMFAAGPAQVVLAIIAAAAAWRPSGSLRDWLSAPIVVTVCGLFAVLITIDLAGINRGEITRLWIFLACFFQLPAAYVCARLNHRAAIAAVLAITLLQVSLSTAMIGWVVP